MFLLIMPRREPRSERPRTVTVSFWFTVAAAGLRAVLFLLSGLLAPSRNVHGDRATALAADVAAGILITVVFTAMTLFAAVRMRQGHTVARWLLLVLTVLSAAVVQGFPVWLGLLVDVVAVTSVVLSFTPAANRYFAPGSAL